METSFEMGGLSRRFLMTTGLGAVAAASLGSFEPAQSDRADQGWPIVELRQDTLYGGGLDELVAVFEREFIENQNVLEPM